MSNESDWSPPYSHDPNPTPPPADPNITLHSAGMTLRITPEGLSALPQRSVDNCYIISTGHGTSGPFVFGGVALLDLFDRHGAGKWITADVLSADGFRTRLSRGEMERESARPVLLALTIDGRPLRRHEGLVRLIVPWEAGDALRQVKWVSEIRMIE